jgi:hypothetical protein
VNEILLYSKSKEKSQQPKASLFTDGKSNESNSLLVFLIVHF